MFCHQCGKELPEGAKFCSACGAPTAAPAQPEAAPIDLDAPVSEFMAPKEPQTVEEPQAAEESGAQDKPWPEAPAPGADVPAEDVPAVESPAEAASAAQTPAAETSTAVIPRTAEGLAQTGPGVSPDQPPAKRRGKAGFVVLGAAAAAVIAVIAAVVWLFSAVPGGGKGGYAYLTEDGELMYLADLKEKTEALELTDEAGWSAGVSFSPDGKMVYFIDAESTLYQISTAELKKDGRPERVARDVSWFMLLDDGRLLYWEKDGSGFSVYDGKESFRLVWDYLDYQLSADQKTLYYTQQDEVDGTLTLYKKALEKDAKGEKLLKNADWIYSSYDADPLVYVEEDGDGGDGNHLTVYSCAPGGSKTKLADGVYSVAGMTADGGLYCWKQDVEERTLYDFVTDAKAKEDAAVLAQGEPEYPSWQKYEVWDFEFSDGTLYCIAYDGTKHPLDEAEVKKRAEAEGWGFYDSPDELVAVCYSMYYYGDYDPLQEYYDKALEEYEAAFDKWYDAQSREERRQELKDTTYRQSSYSLYRYVDGESESIAAGAKSAYGPSAPGEGIFLYRKVDQKDGKVGDVADLSYYGEVYDLLNAEGGSGETTWYQNVGGVESELDLEDFTSVSHVIALSGKEAVLWVYDGSEEALLSYAIGRDALTFASTILEGDDFTIPYAGLAESGKLYLFTDVVEGSGGNGYRSVGDFCRYQGGKLETIAKEVYELYLLDGSGAMYAVTDVDGQYYQELAQLKDGRLSAITDEMSGAPIFLDKTQVLYVSDGDLMLWDGKQERRIARDVEQVWAGAEAAFTGYAPFDAAG